MDIVMNITDIPNKALQVFNTKNNLDKPLCEDLPDPLPNYCGFNFVISGASGSGKTTLMTSFMSAKKKNGVRQSYRKLFDHILVVSPTLGQGKSVKNDVFKSIPESQKWTAFNPKTMKEVNEALEEFRDEGEKTMLILDDIGAQLRKSATAEKDLVSLLQNRRHMFCSVFILVQKYKDLPMGIRNNMSHFVTFRPKNQMEMEAICSETMPFKRAHWQHIMNHVFDNDNKFSFLMIDMSLKQTNKYRYFSGLDEMLIDVKP